MDYLMKYLELFLTSLRLGLTSFGGPIAHLSYFHVEYVQRKKWLSESAYADLVALCQFLPGPASSQVGMAVGLSRGGILGALIAWLGFTLPSAIILILFALGVTQLNISEHQHWLHALKVIAVSVVAQAVFGMWKKLCKGKVQAIIAIIACLIILFTNSAFAQILVLIFAGIFGAFFLKAPDSLPHEPIHRNSHRTGLIFLFLFFTLLFLLPFLASITQIPSIKFFDSFYRAGSLVFGGGHVVLPLLQAEVVPNGWVSKDLFMAGYGVANAIPGPLFAFSAYLGAISTQTPNGWTGAFICLIAAFLPSFLLIVGALPFWEKLRSIPKIRQAMLGLNAAVVGILLAALYNPVWISAIFSWKDFALALIGFLLLERWKAPSWIVVLGAVAVSFCLLL
ncbi:MAG: chromate efflux transporter [Bacteriovoracaceae bacterium]|nr:chromate efflux transporter [Bacteriovoracaceae bacterium]